ncbi:MAG: V-type ATP synthase beta chain [Promethearchaeota archaeon]|nr:MAG: V-type ATP synthase beta chain [Candidatus Lokiarchaeota archaeon]
MSVRYKKLTKIIDPLIYLKNLHDAQFGEIVKIELENGDIRTGRIIEMNEDVIMVQVFEGTQTLSTENAKIYFTGDTFKLKLSMDMLGGVFNALGQPIDIQTKRLKDFDILVEEERDIVGSAINPSARSYPTDIIRTGVSGIDGLFTLIRGQKLPIFSGQGLPHNKLAAQIVTQAHVPTGEPFLVIFCGIGVIQDDAVYFINQFKKRGNIQNIVSFINFADDPVMERLMIPKAALTAAEYFAFEKDMHVLVILINMTNYCEALREISAAKEEIPSRKGYPGYLFSDLARIYERTGRIKDKNGSITQIPILTMPNDDISHPIPDTTGYITEGQLVFSRDLNKKDVYPPLQVLSSISRLMKDAIGEGKTREDHADILSQLIASYSDAQDVRDLISIIGRESLTREQKGLLDFADDFEEKFLNQSFEENRTFEETFDIAWNVLSNLSKNKLNRIKKKYIDRYYP